eukprot:scaffold599_cov282-Pinguiococcus_pyrenoidosus.AAC.7
MQIPGCRSSLEDSRCTTYSRSVSDTSLPDKTCTSLALSHSGTFRPHRRPDLSLPCTRSPRRTRCSAWRTCADDLIEGALKSSRTAVAGARSGAAELSVAAIDAGPVARDCIRSLGAQDTRRRFRLAVGGGAVLAKLTLSLLGQVLVPTRLARDAGHVNEPLPRPPRRADLAHAQG